MQRYAGRVICALRKEKKMRQSELASLTGLKQPNLSRIENGLVEPRQATLEKIGRALGVEVSELFSEKRLLELEAKWGHGIVVAGASDEGSAVRPSKTISVPVFETSAGYDIAFDEHNRPCGFSEMSMNIPNMEGACYALRVYGDSMEPKEGPHTFHHGEIVVFADRPSPKPGDYAFVKTSDLATFKQVFFDEESVRLVPLNRAYQEKVVRRSDIKHMWKLVLHLRHFD